MRNDSTRLTTVKTQQQETYTAARRPMGRFVHTRRRAQGQRQKKNKGWNSRPIRSTHSITQPTTRHAVLATTRDTCNHDRHNHSFRIPHQVTAAEICRCLDSKALAQAAFCPVQICGPFVKPAILRRFNSGSTDLEGYNPHAGLRRCQARDPYKDVSIRVRAAV